MAVYQIEADSFSQIANYGAAPKEGPRTIRLAHLDFTVQDSYSIDLSNIQRQEKLSVVQCVYVDASDCIAQITITFGGTFFTLVVQPNTQGFYPIMATSPVTLTISVSGAPAPTLPTNLPVFLINVPMQ